MQQTPPTPLDETTRRLRDMLDQQTDRADLFAILFLITFVMLVCTAFYACMRLMGV